MIELHVLGLAHLPTVAKDPVWACAYSQKIRRFIEMMKTLDYRITFYGVEGSETAADEEVIVLSEDSRQAVYGDLQDYSNKFFQHDPHDAAYQEFVANAIREINARASPESIICNPMGNYYQSICEQVQGLKCESGIGYTGVLQGTHKVFESQAWRHFVYGLMGQENGIFYDTVIPNFYDPEDYIFRDQKEDFFLQLSRTAVRKGHEISIKTCEAIGAKLLVCGQPGEDVPLSSPNVEYLGYVSEAEKRNLLSRAKGLFSPTLYLGPFEGVAVEAMLSGTPVLSTDFGCFTETVRNGVSGFRCNLLRDFIAAAQRIHEIEPGACRAWAIRNYSMHVIRHQYDAYFKRLMTLFGAGWYEWAPASTRRPRGLGIGAMMIL